MNARRSLVFLAAILLAIPLVSCEPQMALHPWYGEKDIVTEAGFAGTWLLVDDKGKPDDQVTFTFTQNEDKSYTVSADDATQAGVRSAWDVRLFRVNGRLFVDAAQLVTKFNGADVSELFIPGHMVGSLKLTADSVAIRFLDDEWLTKAVKANPALIKNEMVNDSAVITASTGKLQEFASAHASDDKAFAVGFNFVRKK
jgi:hypothetical protein